MNYYWVWEVYRKCLKIPLPKENLLPKRPFYSCLLGDLAFEWQRGWRWPCFDTNLSAFVMQMHLVSIRTTRFTQQKQWGLYQNKVTSSLAAIQRPGHWADNCNTQLKDRFYLRHVKSSACYALWPAVLSSLYMYMFSSLNCSCFLCYFNITDQWNKNGDSVSFSHMAWSQCPFNS